MILCFQNVPFILIGISDLFAEMKVLELTSPIDKYLIENVGYSLLEMKIQTERPNGDFRANCPLNQKESRRRYAHLLILIEVDIY